MILNIREHVANLEMVFDLQTGGSLEMDSEAWEGPKNLTFQSSRGCS